MRTLLVVLLLSLPAAALGQSEAAAPIDDRPSQKLTEVEHGVYVGAEAGGLFLFGPKNSEGGGFSTGRMFAFHIGGDVGEMLSLGLMVMGTHTDTPAGFKSDFTAPGASSPMRGDFSTLILGATAKVNFLGLPDANNVKRVFFNVRGGGGYALLSPSDFYAGNDIAVLGGLGVEYFTHLRHFSIGLNADFFYGLNYLGPGFSVSPNLRYNF